MSSKNSTPAFLFDLDGTLVDNVYHHVIAWREALQSCDIQLPVWRIHRRIGMSGGLFANALLREAGEPVTRERAEKLQKRHAQEFRRHEGHFGLLPGARKLLHFLTEAGIPWAIASSGKRESAGASLDMLQLDPATPVITRNDVERAKPEPDLFYAASARLGTEIQNCVVVGDSVWDLLAAQRARALGIGLLSGGYGQDELERAGAYRVYRDPGDLLDHIDEVGIRAENLKHKAA